MSDALKKLQAELVEKSSPGLRKCEETTLRDLCTDRAARLLAVGLGASELSQRALAQRLTRASRGRKAIDEKQVRQYLEGSADVHLWAILALPRDGLIALLIALTSLIPDTDEESDALLEDDERGAA